MACTATLPDALVSRQLWTDTRSPIASLPVELLRVILKYAFVSVRTETSGTFHRSRRQLKGIFKAAEETPIDTVWTGTDKLADPFLFPRNVASISTGWRTISESLPMLWMRIALCVDFRPTPFSIIRASLEFSKDLPLDIIVFRGPGTFIGSDLDEYARCRAVIELLRPHIHRCRKLTFDVIHSSSLPSISDDFHGAAPHLKTLKLRYRISDGTRPGGQLCIPRCDADQFSARRLNEIIVDGRNFAHACVKMPTFAASLRQVKSLEIFDFTPDPTIPGDNAFTLWAFVAVLSHIHVDTLILSRIDLPFDPADPPTPEIAFHANILKLDTLTNQFTRQLLMSSLWTFSELHITRCSITGITFGIYAQNMTLREIAPSEDMAVFLASWTGECLEVLDCHAFDDHALTGLVAGTQDRGVRQLRISDCTGFSVGMLRAAVKLLNERAVQYFHDQLEMEGWDEPPLALEMLEVTGRGPVRTEEDLCWLKEHVECLAWTATQEGEA